MIVFVNQHFGSVPFRQGVYRDPFRRQFISEGVDGNLSGIHIKIDAAKKHRIRDSLLQFTVSQVYQHLSTFDVKKGVILGPKISCNLLPDCV